MANLEWYRSFVAIYQCGTVSAAAQKLALTQPAVSQHLAALEQQFGHKLFERTPRQMQATEAGKALYAQVIGAIEQLDRLSHNSALFPHTPALKIRLGVPREYFYACGLRRLPSQTPSPYHLELVLGQTGELLKQLELGQLEAVIATHRVKGQSFHYRPLLQEEFVLIGPPSLAVPPELSSEKMLLWLEEQDWIAYSADLPIIRRYWQNVFGRHPNIQVRVLVPDLLMIVESVILGLGISVVPDYLCQEALAKKQVRILWEARQGSNNQLYLVCQTQHLMQPEVQWVFSTLAGEI